MNGENISPEDRQWGWYKAETFGVAATITDEETRRRILEQSALILADVRHYKRAIGLTVPDEGTFIER